MAAAAVAARAAAAATAAGAAGATAGVKAEQANGVKAEPVFPSGPVINTVEGELGKVQTKEEDDKFMYSTKVRRLGFLASTVVSQLRSGGSNSHGIVHSAPRPSRFAANILTSKAGASTRLRWTV